MFPLADVLCGANGRYWIRGLHHTTGSSDSGSATSSRPIRCRNCKLDRYCGTGWPILHMSAAWAVIRKLLAKGLRCDRIFEVRDTIANAARMPGRNFRSSKQLAARSKVDWSAPSSLICGSEGNRGTGCFAVTDQTQVMYQPAWHPKGRWQHPCAYA